MVEGGLSGLKSYEERLGSVTLGRELKKQLPRTLIHFLTLQIPSSWIENYPLYSISLEERNSPTLWTPCSATLQSCNPDEE